MSGDHRPVIRYPSEYVKLNIGGSLHYTTISTLRKHDTMLRAMFSGRMDVHTDSEGILFIYYLTKSCCSDRLKFEFLLKFKHKYTNYSCNCLFFFRLDTN